MKRLSILTLIICSFAVQQSVAQLGIGLKGGLNFPTINDLNGAGDYSSATGFHGGAMAEIKLTKIGVQAEALFSKTGYTVPTIGEVKSAYFDIPVIAKFYPIDLLSIHVGPQFSYVLSSESDILGNIKSDFSDRNFKIVAGAGLKLGPIDVHGRIIFPSKTTFKSVSQEYKNQTVQVSVGYWFN